jgi:hypothetical protein
MLGLSRCIHTCPSSITRMEEAAAQAVAMMPSQSR